MTTPYYADDSVTLWHGDCLDVLRTLPDASVDAVCTDPPYGLGFMGKAWDAEFIATTTETRRQYAGDPSGGTSPNGGFRSAAAEAGRYDLSPTGNAAFQAWCEQWATECLRVLKPGGHMLAFGGTRTWHRLACAVEDAGFEVRDSIAWLYGSGFPKSLDVSKAIDRAAGAEREVVGPGRWNGVKGDNANQVDVLIRPGGKHDETAPATDDARTWQGWGTALKPAFEPVVVARKPLDGTVASNVLRHGTGALNVDGCRIGVSEADRPAVQGREFVAENVERTAYGDYAHDGGRRAIDYAPGGRWPANVVLDESQAVELDRQSGVLTSGVLAAHHQRAPKDAGILGAYGSAEGERGYGDQGGASRFFYVAKAPTAERPREDGVAHPTVKPLDLMRWLVRLVTPPGGTVLEPFAGSGTTAEACVIEGFRCIAIEREADYLPLIVQRLTKPIQPDLFGGAA